MFGKQSIGDLLTVTTRILSDSLSDELVSLVFYGNLVDAATERTDYRPESVRLLIVLRELDAVRMARLADSVKAIKGYDRLSMMLVTEAELKNSTDVFPITFLDIKRNYRLLSGIDILQQTKVQRTHLRLRCEQELKNLLFRMQSNAIKLRSSRRFQSAFASNHEAFLRVLGGSLLLLDITPPADETSLIEVASEQFKFPSETIRRIQHAITQTRIADLNSMTELYFEFIDIVRQVATIVDAMPDDWVIVDVIEEVQ